MPNTDSKPTSEKEQTQAPQISPHTTTYCQQIEADTIDFYELWITLWNRKGLVIAITAAATLVSVIYALEQPHVYRAEALLLPPGAKDIQSLNISVLEDVQEINPTGVFNEFKTNLRSHTLQKKFVLENGLMDLLAPERIPETGEEEIYENFAEMIELETTNGSTSVSIELHDAKIASKWINDLIKFI
ncbi:MAG: Wzz/FepE/Etk N-terminal domain-containing protein, partial [SAR324 cluster bacterium]|nr:Wzz/FepE/Etk N-terminal domain-containing protein [SAR324 cluster bacterium]